MQVAIELQLVALAFYGLPSYVQVDGMVGHTGHALLLVTEEVVAGSEGLAPVECHIGRQPLPIPEGTGFQGQIFVAAFIVPCLFGSFPVAEEVLVFVIR